MNTEYMLAIINKENFRRKIHHFIKKYSGKNILKNRNYNMAKNHERNWNLHVYD